MQLAQIAQALSSNSCCDSQHRFSIAGCKCSVNSLSQLVHSSRPSCPRLCRLLQAPLPLNPPASTYKVVLEASVAQSSGVQGKAFRRRRESIFSRPPLLLAACRSAAQNTFRAAVQAFHDLKDCLGHCELQSHPSLHAASVGVAPPVWTLSVLPNTQESPPTSCHWGDLMLLKAT